MIGLSQLMDMVLTEVLEVPEEEMTKEQPRTPAELLDGNGNCLQMADPEDFAFKGGAITTGFDENGEFGVTVGGGRLKNRVRVVMVDGKPTFKFQCPKCNIRGSLDDDQFHGRVSILCDCGFHETIDVAGEYDAATC